MLNSAPIIWRVGALKVARPWREAISRAGGNHGNPPQSGTSHTVSQWKPKILTAPRGEVGGATSSEECNGLNSREPNPYAAGLGTPQYEGGDR